MGSDVNTSGPQSLRVYSSRGAWTSRSLGGAFGHPWLARGTCSLGVAFGRPLLWVPHAVPHRTGLGTRAFGAVSGCVFSALPALGSSRHLNAWLARLYTAGHGMAFGRPMCCECDTHAPRLSGCGIFLTLVAFGLGSDIQDAESARQWTVVAL